MGIDKIDIIGMAGIASGITALYILLKNSTPEKMRELRQKLQQTSEIVETLVELSEEQLGKLEKLIEKDKKGFGTANFGFNTQQQYGFEAKPHDEEVKFHYLE